MVYVNLLAVVLVGPLIFGVAVFYSTGSLNHPAFWAVLAAAVAIFAVLFCALQNRSVILEGNALVVRTTFYSFRVRLEDVTAMWVESPGASKIIGTRLHGVGLPGFKSGWFRHPGGKIFVDIGRTDFLLLEIRGAAGLALGFSDTGACRKLILAAVPLKWNELG